jgi:hypothetical protein
MATRNDKPNSENPLYNDNEIEDDYLGDEVRDDAEESENQDDRADYMNSVPTGVIERAIEITKQPRNGRRLYRNGLRLDACGSSRTTNEVVAGLVPQLLHCWSPKNKKMEHPSSTLLIIFCQRAKHINIWSDLRVTV